LAGGVPQRLPTRVPTMLEVDAVGVRLGERRFQFDLRVATGQRVAVTGASGSGKSTLLNIIGGFLSPLSGAVRWHGEAITALTPDCRPVTTLFQRDNLFEHLTVARNIGLGLNSGLRLSAAQQEEVGLVLEQVGLAGMQARLPGELSGGEQQRVALARSLLRDKPLLLLDEPYSALDEGTRQDMLSLTDDIATAHHLTVVMVTHRHEDASVLAASVYRMDDDRLQPVSC